MNVQKGPWGTLLAKKIHFGREISRIQAILRGAQPLSMWIRAEVRPLWVAVRRRSLCEAGV